MLATADDWRDELLDLASRLEAACAECPPEGLGRLQTLVTMGCIVARRMDDLGQAPHAMGYQVPLRKYFKRRDAENRFEHYDTNRSEPWAKPVRYVCGNIIHALIFERSGEGDSVDGFFVWAEEPKRPGLVNAGTFGEPLFLIKVTDLTSMWRWVADAERGSLHQA